MTIVVYMDVESMMSVPETADLLGVDRRRVHALIAQRRLPALRVGRDWRISVRDATRFQQAQRRPGRPMSPSRAWALLIEAERSGRIDLPRGSAERDPFWLVNLTRQRATVQRMHVLDRLSVGVARQVVAAGESAGRFHGTSPRDSNPMCDGYVTRSRADELIEDFALVDAIAGDVNVVLRIVDDTIWPFGQDQKVVGPLVAAVDMLSDPVDDRSIESAIPIVERYL